MSRLTSVFAILFAAGHAPAFHARVYGPVVLNPGGHPYDVKAATLTLDGRRVLTLGMEGALRGWDADTGKPAFTLWLPPPVSPDRTGSSQLCLSPDGKLLAVRYDAETAPRDRLCLLPLDERGGYRVVVGHGGHITDLAFAPNGRRLVTGAMDHKVRVWDVATGKVVREWSTGPAYWPTSVTFTPDGARVTAAVREAESGSAVRTWDLAGGKLDREITGVDAGEVAWSPDGRRLAVRDVYGVFRLLDPDGTVRGTFGKVGAPPEASQFLNDGRFITVESRSRPDAVVVCDENRELLRLPGRPGGGWWRGTLTPDGRRLLSVWPLAGEAAVWDVATGKEVCRFQAQTAFPPVAVGWSADGKRLAWRHRLSEGQGEPVMEQGLRRADLTAGPVEPGEKYLRSRKEWDGVKVTAVDGYSVTVVTDGKERVIHYDSGIEGDDIRSVTVLAGGKVLLGAVAGLTGYDARTGKVEVEYASCGLTFGLAPSPDGKLFAAIGLDPVIAVYRVGRKEPVLFVLPVGPEWVAWTPAGDWAGSARGGELAGYVREDGPDKLRTFVPLSANPDRRRPEQVSAAVLP